MYLYDALCLISSLEISYQNFYNNMPLNEINQIAQQNNARLQRSQKPRTQITTKPFHCGKRVSNFNLDFRPNVWKFMSQGPPTNYSTKNVGRVGCQFTSKYNT